MASVDPVGRQSTLELREIVKALGIADYHVCRPRLNNPQGVNYGVWLQFRKER